MTTVEERAARMARERIDQLRATATFCEDHPELVPPPGHLYIYTVEEWRVFSADAGDLHVTCPEYLSPERRLVTRGVDGVAAVVHVSLLPPAVCPGSELPSELDR